MTDPRKEFLTKHFGVSDSIADTLMHGGWPDVDSPDDKDSPATKKTAKSYKHFKQDHEAEVKAAFGPCDTLDESVGPLVAYHGTKADFDEFKTPAWFTPDKKMAHGFAGELADGVRNEHSKVYTVHLDLKNPYKTDDWDVSESKAYNPKWRKQMMAKGHDGVHFTSEDGEHEYIAFHPHQIKIVAKESAAGDHLEESREDFMAKYGSAVEIHKIIDAWDKGENSSTNVSMTMKNPSFNREHHERLLNHGSRYMRHVALNSPHITADDIHGLVSATNDPFTVNNAVMHPKISTETLKHIALNFDHSNKDSADKVRANAVNYANKRNAWSEPEIRAVMEKHNSGGSPKTYDAAHIAHYYISRPAAVRQTFESTEIPRIMAGIGTDKPLDSPWASYWFENKQIWVPTSHIIADAHETNEGLRQMVEEAGEFVLFEDGMVKSWLPHELSSHLLLSQSVHAHYKDAGVAHYPYRDLAGKVSMDRINAVAKFNNHSRPVNDFLIRNFHGQGRSWDREHHPQVGHLDSIFNHAPKTTNPINTMSGLKQSPQDLIDHVRSLGHEIGDHIYMHLPAYTSTSTRFSTAAAFVKYHKHPDEPTHADAHMFHIHVPAGHKMIGMEAHPDRENSEEHELVLPRDTILKVNTTPAVYRIGNKHMHVWHSEVHGTNPTPLKD
jgi:hypothetical protein